MKEIQIQSLRLENVDFAFPGREPIFENLSFDLPMNKIVWVSGGSGSGKSVLIRLLNAMLMPTAGRYYINGEPASEMTFEEFLPYRLKIGYSFDFGGLINNRTIFQNLLLPLEYHNLKGVNIAERVHEFLARFNLLSVGNERPSAIPGALRKAACVARAFMLMPEMLLLDDPTTGLRVEVRQRLKDLILESKENGQIRHVFIASEDQEFMRDLAEDHILIENKKLRLLSGSSVAA